MVLRYWSDLFSEEVGQLSAERLPSDYFPRIGAEDFEIMMRPLSEAEVSVALKSMKPYKAPGPDGFQPLFNQRFWDMVKPNVMRLVSEILAGREFPEGFNDAYIVLIPKMATPQFAKHFRPIGLCNIVYKIVTKVIINRLKPVLPSLISPTQCSFVPKRQITDNVIIVQEMLHSMRNKQGKKGYMAVKIDFEKAYDRLRWAFIRESLMELRIPQHLVDIVMTCINSANLLILWNGEPMEKFAPSRGIRQGDPLSPYLYVICMERLAHLIDQEVHNGNWKPVKASRGGPPISNLAFADDLILFTEASVEQAQVMKWCLDRFCAASGSKVNVDKSKIYFSANTHLDIRDAICNNLAMESTDDFGKYLGVPTINGRTSKREYQYLVDRINGKLAGWKTKTLSIAGRATLIQSALSSIPYYTMQSTKLPRSTCDEIDRKTRSFLWGEQEGRRRVHLVAWENISNSKQAGGLGIRSMRQANSAFLAKLGWRLLAEPALLWSRVVRAKYCNNRCDINMFKEKSNASSTWRGILSSIDIVRKGINSAVGNGAKTLFWHHRWATSEPLITLASPMPPLEVQDVTVKEMWDVATGWKLDMFANYLTETNLKLIAAHELVDDEEAVDEIFWNGAPSGGFTIGSAMNILKNNELNSMSDKGKWREVWSIPTPQRIRFFLWLAIQDRLMTNGNRFLRQLTSDPRCLVCGEVEENTKHILRRCPVARILWRKLGLIEDHSLEETDLEKWILKNIHKDSRMGSEWPKVFSVTCWWLWRWRNDRSFNRNPSIPVDQVSFIFSRVGEIKAAMERNDFARNPTPRRRQEVLVRWQHPREGWVKLNTDGASKGNPGPAGGGGLIRGPRGEIYEVFALNCGSCSCTKAELMAVLRGLQIAWEGNHKHVLVLVDSEVVAKILLSDAPASSPYIHIIKRCLSLIARKEWKIAIEHCY